MSAHKTGYFFWLLFGRGPELQPGIQESNLILIIFLLYDILELQIDKMNKEWYLSRDT